jgi:hypothetical protein
MIPPIPDCEELSAEELDQLLEQATRQNELSECQICFYLQEVQRKKTYEAFGFQNIYDYALDRFDIKERKTTYMLSLARKLKELPNIAAALQEGRIRWSKAHKIAVVAKPENEVMWLESALTMRARQLEQKIDQEYGVTHRKYRFCLTEEQAAVFEYAIEICRRLENGHVSPTQCLEMMAAEFIATWGARVEGGGGSGEEDSTETAQESAETGEPVAIGENAETIRETIGEVCPETSESPPAGQPDPNPYLAIYERDGWCCTYPGCSVRAMLHPHHLKFRSKFGKKSKAECEDPSNITTICYFHHLLVHQGVLKVEGKAPFDMKWTQPRLIDVENMRKERKAAERKRKQKQKKTERQESSDKTVDAPRTVWVEGLGPVLIEEEDAA